MATPFKKRVLRSRWARAGDLRSTCQLIRHALQRSTAPVAQSPKRSASPVRLDHSRREAILLTFVAVSYGGYRSQQEVSEPTLRRSFESSNNDDRSRSRKKSPLPESDEDIDFDESDAGSDSEEEEERSPPLKKCVQVYQSLFLILIENLQTQVCAEGQQSRSR